MRGKYVDCVAALCFAKTACGSRRGWTCCSDSAELAIGLYCFLFYSTAPLRPTLTQPVCRRPQGANEWNLRFFFFDCHAIEWKIDLVSLRRPHTLLGV